MNEVIQSLKIATNTLKKVMQPKRILMLATFTEYLN